jgi:hypothetical protein
MYLKAFKGTKLLHIICCPVPALVMTCFGLASLAILFEAIKVYEAHVKYSTVLGEEHCHSTRCTNERSPLLGNNRMNDKSSHISYSQKYVSFLI